LPHGEAVMSATADTVAMETGLEGRLVEGEDTVPAEVDVEGKPRRETHQEQEVLLGAASKEEL